MKPQPKSQEIADRLKRDVEASGADQAIIFFRNGDDMGAMIHGSPEFLMAVYQMMQKEIMVPIMKQFAREVLKEDGDVTGTAKAKDINPEDLLDESSEGYKLFNSIPPLSDKTN